MSDTYRLVQQFLQKNGLTQTLKSFKNQSKKPLQHKNIYHQLANIHKLLIPNDLESENKLRDHLQKTDEKSLRRFAQRMKKRAQTRTLEKLDERLQSQPFFKRTVQKQLRKYEQFKENMRLNMNKSARLDESRCCQNEWEGENDIGFEIFEFPIGDLPKIIKEIMNSPKYSHQRIKETPYPFKYYQDWQQVKYTQTYNLFDQLLTRLPANVAFQSKSTPRTSIETQESGIYPLESDGVVLSSCDLKVIYDRQKTGFEDDRQMTIVINQVLAGRYQIISVLGQAQFSKAIQVKDLTSTNQKQRYSIKMILNNKDYVDQAFDQIKLLKYIKANCSPDQACLINMHDFFYHREHLMILTEILKDNLYDAYKSKPEYFNLHRIQLITKQILTALATLHKLHIIHCDLKPENILIKSYTNTQVKVIDVGSSVFFHDQPQFYVQTRSYRAPEVILGCQYTEKIDIWGLGCIITELFTKQVLFESDSALGLLARVQGLRGPWPSWMIQNGKEASKYFTKQMILHQEILQQIGEEVDGKRKKKKTGFCRVILPKMSNLKARLKSSNANFIDFLSKCLKIDPSIRISAKQALSHPFITEPILQE